MRGKQAKRLRRIAGQASPGAATCLYVKQRGSHPSVMNRYRGRVLEGIRLAPNCTRSMYRALKRKLRRRAQVIARASTPVQQPKAAPPACDAETSMMVDA